ncbi:MAG TPA: hypothetical protein VFN79_13470 [Steroidobacteraceae bacterium]|nr:hypothetical protein [Steroidobacteraceae bacterium]
MNTLGLPELAGKDELRALQLERLRWAVRHAYRNVGHYRRTFDAVGAHPDDLRTLEDLARFPCLSKQDFRDNYPFDLFAVPREKVVRLHASSLRTAGLSPHYRLEMARAGHLNALKMHVECDAQSADDDSRQRAARELGHHVKSLIGITIDIAVHLPGTLERSVGKAKRVHDR